MSRWDEAGRSRWEQKQSKDRVYKGSSFNDRKLTWSRGCLQGRQPGVWQRSHWILALGAPIFLLNFQPLKPTTAHTHIHTGSSTHISPTVSLRLHRDSLTAKIKGKARDSWDHSVVAVTLCPLQITKPFPPLSQLPQATSSPSSKQVGQLKFIYIHIKFFFLLIQYTLWIYTRMCVCVFPHVSLYICRIFSSLPLDPMITTL